ncbi:hypothetical protein [Bradyrhizobium sp. BR 1432]|uniref:hypothetical protein n=1 Tax=Bradyrhizobium sp. BR 1432 TaxID=3447966 RepID=UPI003EE7193B
MISGSMKANGTTSASAGGRVTISSTLAKVDHGFDKASAADLQTRVKPPIRKMQPIAHKGIWVEPKLLAQVEYGARCGSLPQKSSRGSAAVPGNGILETEICGLD